MINKVLHIMLGFYVMMLSSGIVINKHYCGEMLESVSVFFEAERCLDRSEPMEGCCHDESAVFNLEEDLFNPSKLTAELAPFFQVIVPEFTFLSELFDTSVSSKSLRLPDYSPPPLIADIQVEVQSFLL